MMYYTFTRKAGQSAPARRACVTGCPKGHHKNFKKICAYAAALALGVSAFGNPANALAAQVGDVVDGSYVMADGTPIDGVMAKGITVTKYQNRADAIDWNALAADGISFAMVRIGYYQDQDPYYGMNMAAAEAAGIKTGAFLYTQALDVQSAIDEANYVLEVVKDYAVQYPIAYDVESQVLLDNGLTRQQITDNVNAFCRTIQDAGYHPMVYGNNEWLTKNMDTSQIPYDIWYARYGTINDYPNRTIWQCTDQGAVEGIKGNVTLELAFVDYQTLIPADGWKHIGGRYYYMKDYHKQTGWVEVDGKWYYLDSNGIMVHDTTMPVDGVEYTFGPDGAIVSV